MINGESSRVIRVLRVLRVLRVRCRLSIDCPIFVRKHAASITVRPLPNQNQIIINPHRLYILSIPSHPFFL